MSNSMIGGYVSDGQTYYPVPRGENEGAYETPSAACLNAQQFMGGSSMASYTPTNGFALGGSCAAAGSTFNPPNNMGYVCDGNSNVWVDANWNISGNNWDSSSVQEACKNCNSKFTPGVPQYIELGSCQSAGSFSYDIKSDGTRWYYTLLPESSVGNTNPASACGMAKQTAPTLAGFSIDASQGKSCKALGSLSQTYNYNGSQASGSVISAEIASAVEGFSFFDTNSTHKTLKIVVLILILIVIGVIIYSLVSKEEKKADFYFC